MACAKGLRHKKEKDCQTASSKISLLPHFLLIPRFLDLGSCVKEPTCVLHIAGKHCAEQVQQAPLLTQLETTLVLQ